MVVGMEKKNIQAGKTSSTAIESGTTRPKETEKVKNIIKCIIDQKTQKLGINFLTKRTDYLYTTALNRNHQILQM